MRISNIVFAYFIIGTMMWGGGALSFEEAGVVTGVVTNDDGQIQANSSMSSELDEQDNVISGVINTFSGGLNIAWNIISIVFKFLHWPIFTLAENHAPPEITVLLGGGMTLSFYLAILTLVTRAS